MLDLIVSVPDHCLSFYITHFQTYRERGIVSYFPRRALHITVLFDAK